MAGNEKGEAVNEPVFLTGGGEMGKLIAEFDWASTSLGPMDSWPQSLKTSISLMLNSQHPMWIGWGPNVIFFYNDAYIQVLSMAKHPAALGKPTAEVWAEIWDVCGPLADKVFQKGEASYLNDVRLFMSRGDFLEETFYSFSYSPIRDESGQVGGLFCPSAEVTPKVLNTRRLRTLSELAAESLVEKSTEGACASAAAILARNRDDIPFALLYLIDPEGKSATLEQAIGLLKGKSGISPQAVDLTGHAKDDVPWPIAKVAETAEAQVKHLANADGFPLGAADQPVSEVIVLPVVSRGQERPLGVMVAGVNPTRKLDTEYRTFYALVASHVATAIQNARATEEEKKRADMLAEIDRAKTVFFSNVSHELRTPLTLILGPLEDEIRESPGSRERLELAHRNSLRLLKLVNTLLDFSRIEAGRVEPSFEPTDLSAFTAELASVFRSGIEKAGLRLIVDCAPLPGPVYVDREMWEKIVFNLLSNAFKFTAQGEIVVILSAVKKDETESVCLVVRDTGIGIPETELPRVFERFRRVQNEWARSHEGTGIGLALVQELARLHGGGAEVASVLGRGTTFTVTIPAGRGQSLEGQVVRPLTSSRRSKSALTIVDEAQQWLPENIDAASQNHTNGKLAENGASPARIVLADDNHDMRGYVQRLLAQQGYEVTAVSDGQAALEQVRTQAPSLVLSDIMMPRLDGFGLVKELRNDPVTRAIPIILLSARAGEEARVEGVEAGANDYLVKPFSARELLARVGSQIELARAEKALREANALLADKAAHLESLVQQRTVKLRDTIGELEAFSYSIAHDMRAPLRSLQGFSDILLTDYAPVLDADCQRYLKRISSAAERMDKLIQDVLNYSQVVRSDLHLEKVDLEQLLHDIVDVYPMFAPDKADISVVSPIPPVMGNEAMLTQVFSNLMGNAVKFVGPGVKSQIKVWAESRTPQVRVFVGDNGIGIAPDQHEKIFDIFQQVNKTFEGTGIGLAIVKKAAERMGGKVGVQSTLEHGSTFWVELRQA